MIKQWPLFSLIFLLSISVQGSDCGLFQVVKKDVQLKKKGAASFKKARKNQKVCLNDRVRSGVDSRAKVVLPSGDEINISPESEMFFSTLYQNKVVLNVGYGRIRSQVKKKYEDNKQSHFRVKTKSAVAGVRGTDFITGYNRASNETRVVTFVGVVAVGNSPDGAYRPQVMVEAGHFTGSQGRQSPRLPQKLTPDQMQQMDRDTEVVEPTAGNGGHRGLSNEKEKKNKKPKKTKQIHQESAPEATNREPSSVRPSEFDQAVADMEHSILGETGDVDPGISLSELPEIPRVVDGGSVAASPQLQQNNMINNLIQNKKATVNFSIGVKD